MGGCTREQVLKLLVRLERELARDLEGWPEARKRALERIMLYKLEVEERLAEEPVFG